MLSAVQWQLAGLSHQGWVVTHRARSLGVRAAGHRSRTQLLLRRLLLLLLAGCARGSQLPPRPQQDQQAQQMLRAGTVLLRSAGHCCYDWKRCSLLLLLHGCFSCHRLLLRGSEVVCPASLGGLPDVGCAAAAAALRAAPLGWLQASAWMQQRRKVSDDLGK